LTLKKREKGGKFFNNASEVEKNLAPTVKIAIPLNQRKEGVKKGWLGVEI